MQPHELLRSDGTWLHVCKTNYGQSSQGNAAAVEVSVSCQKSNNTQARQRATGSGCGTSNAEKNNRWIVIQLLAEELVINRRLQTSVLICKADLRH